VGLSILSMSCLPCAVIVTFSGYCFFVCGDDFRKFVIYSVLVIIIHYLLFVIRYRYLLFANRLLYSLFIICYLIFDILLFDIRYLLFAICCSFFVISLFAVRGLIVLQILNGRYA